jgi:hypothetical protein
MPPSMASFQALFRRINTSSIDLSISSLGTFRLQISAGALFLYSNDISVVGGFQSPV